MTRVTRRGLQDPFANTELLRGIRQLILFRDERLLLLLLFIIFFVTSKCYNLGMKTHAKEIASLGCGDTSLITSKLAYQLLESERGESESS